ncbi:hypothetical protein KEJ19_06455, partial [Candidatus Bathyarchaeota archaeon]|nr:hypothetical protein [Candidatus Bathyarchaeota archaeon]
TKREVKGEWGAVIEVDGTLMPGITIQDPTIRSSEAAQSIVEEEARHLWEFILTIDVVGNPEIKLGDGISIKGFDNQELNGTYQVIGVRHYLSNTKGFVTTVEGKRGGKKVVKLTPFRETFEISTER